ncbi:DUF202 domain-containing protein [Fulvivirga kasyanovii]|uniref:DUF202 domain-containing protein n=1 Tax=Fulvivirga kasyanovii TaxID=396812 RepID=A0ABW9RPF8_9BACT|nr:DUF202 domain-containing protein [Fulvivirga kasyanovii]MTI25632.1 DUF202 domain-containing protein [Fulvivirga kasyanovii]
MRDRRHYFARIRTQLANERTLMSYYRGSLALVGISAFIFKFFVSWLFSALSLIFLILGISMAVYGTTRYFRFKKKILRK